MIIIYVFNRGCRLYCEVHGIARVQTYVQSDDSPIETVGTECEKGLSDLP